MLYEIHLSSAITFASLLILHSGWGHVSLRLKSAKKSKAWSKAKFKGKLDLMSKI